MCMGAGGVPFYGQQQKMGGPIGYGGIGGGAGGFASGAGTFGAAPAQSTGGFTYGMASKGGSLFGPPSGATNPVGGT